jgi:hypothetical protein
VLAHPLGNAGRESGNLLSAEQAIDHPAEDFFACGPDAVAGQELFA